jgi:lantibiotic biosynthesis protein
MYSDESRFLEAAAALGRSITGSAIWCERRCNWMGAHPEGSVSSGALATQAALGPDLYGGTSGVGLFLAEASARIGDESLRATAVGAIRHALDHACHIDAEIWDGLYTGPVGIAYAAARVAQVLEAESLLTGAREVLLTWRRHRSRSAASDVMSGCSGAVAGLVALSELVEESWIVETAVRLGDELTARAEASPTGWSWPRPGPASMYNLCGYAHGAAGIGHALFELFGVTGERRFRQAGERAFDYERWWFDSRTGNWPDLRDVTRRAGRSAPMPSANSWCNGAPGIALSRLRAKDLLESPSVRRDADHALAACERHVSELLMGEADDFSLCHGAAGAADVLLYAASRPDQRRLAAEVGRHGIERHLGLAGTGFPCGVPVGETPGLLLGLAGIGMFYLRLCDPGVGTPLLVRRNRLTSLLAAP